MLRLANLILIGVGGGISAAYHDKLGSLSALRDSGSSTGLCRAGPIPMEAQAPCSLAYGSGEGLKWSREWGDGKKRWVKKECEDRGYFHFFR